MKATLILVIVFLNLTGFTVCGDKICKYPNPVPKPYLFGHNCYFKQNFSEFPLSNGGFDLGVLIPLLSATDLTADEEDRVLNFMSGDIPPYVVNVRDKEGFPASNPMFSLSTKPPQSTNTRKSVSS